ncbi:GNAT family N-acetyltransferase [Nitrosophilus labii]|uniref:GNAT family N-acetyltransferase n=1 Tax=Nitrosophilus labii TaxID=2706014 RepID=UPI001656A65F|nr:GNAT family N-acetyltransferase [Nitrosophilus labii]
MESVLIKRQGVKPKYNLLTDYSYRQFSGNCYYIKGIEIYNLIKEAKLYYPKFDLWYFGKVLPGLSFQNRKFLIEKRDTDIAGIAIIKHSLNEKKLCTLRVIDNYQNRGIGIKLFERAFEELETDKPFLTVSEEKYEQFKRIFDYYGFKMTSKKKGLYRKDKYEYFFNEFSK